MKGNLSDDRERYESGRPKPTSRTVATAKGTNRKHWKLGIKYATRKFQSRGKLRTLRQVDFPTVLSWPEKKCFSILKKAGVFGDRRNRRCWVCKAAMVPESQTQAYRCVNRQCSGQRPRLYSWQFSFTPFGGRLRGGHPKDCKAFVCAAYLCSLKCPQDSSWHVLGRSQDYTDLTFRQLRVCAAFAQLQESKAMRLDPGMVDIDGTRTFGKSKTFDKRTLTAKAKSQLRKKPTTRSGKPVSKKPASMIHAGRFLLLKHRTSGQQAVLPLPDRKTKRDALGPPESKDEVLPLLKTKLCSTKHIVGSDASKGLQGAMKEMNLTAATARRSHPESADQLNLVCQKFT